MEKDDTSRERQPSRLSVERRPLVLSPGEHSDITSDLINVATQLEHHALPDVHVYTIDNVTLTEPLPDDLRAVIEPIRQTLSMTYANLADGTRRAQIRVRDVAINTLTLNLDSHSDRPLNDWHVKELGVKKKATISHGDLLNYLLDRMEPDFIAKEMIDHPSIDDETMLRYLVRGFQASENATYKNAHYYKANDFMFDQNFTSELGVSIGIIKSPQSKEYVCRLGSAVEIVRKLSPSENDTDRYALETGEVKQEYKYTVSVPYDNEVALRQKAHLTLESGDVTTGRLQAMADDQVFAADCRQIFQHAITLAHGQHLKYDDDILAT